MFVYFSLGKRSFMKIYAIIFLFLVYLGPSASYSQTAIPLCEGTIESLVKSRKFVKNYIALNWLFPQINTAIDIGNVAFYFYENPRFVDINRFFTAEEWEEAFSSMQRAHRVFGISREVSLEELVMTIHSFPLSRLLRHTERSIRLVLFLQGEYSFDSFKNNELIDSFEKSRDFDEVRESLSEYSKTLLEALKSKEMGEVSQRYKRTLSQNLKPDQEPINTVQASSFVVDFLEEKLLERHPELRVTFREWDGTRINYDRTAASWLISIMVN